jgi:hypothetical protein
MMARDEREENFFASVQTFLFGKQPTLDEMVKKWRKDLTVQTREVNRNIRSKCKFSLLMIEVLI